MPGTGRVPTDGPDLALREFLERLTELGGGGATTTLALVVAGVREPVWEWAVRYRVGVHLVPETASWARLAHVACLLAAAARPGAVSATALGHVLGDQALWTPFYWLSRT